MEHDANVFVHSILIRFIVVGLLVGYWWIANIKVRKKIRDIRKKNEEKKFFTKMYPNEKDQIVNYHFYSKEGDKNGVALGSLFDKRG